MVARLDHLPLCGLWRGADLIEPRRYHAQAEQAAERLVKLLGGKGKVAIMQGVPTVGKITEIGLDDLNQLLELIDQGVVDSSVSTKPKMQGYWAVLALWQKAHGANLPDRIHTGVVTITKDMIKGYQGESF